ncbi:hypothetical protein PVAND_010732 [Polypedilum vanderplanki]|uniref:Uncharacterized protein n=1 Tax=Polypedilum vanderplanki TaxID=319348 RepID=A0A9J6CGH4_POLVA|nr:hypothetical protein PVAND_010732 [Polypedilum vanderplanki]
MDLNSSIASNDTDKLIRIPHNFFEVDLNDSKSYFSNEVSFMKEIDNFLIANTQKDLLNSTNHELPSYSKFVDTLQQSSNEQDTDLNIQLITIFQKKISNCQEKIAKLTKANLEKGEIIRKLKNNEGLDTENASLKQKNKLLEDEIADMINLFTKLQSKNDSLESKIENLTSNSKEINDLSKKQIQELEIRLNNFKQIEKELQTEIQELKIQCKEEKEKYIKEKSSKSELETLVNKLKLQTKQAKEENSKLQEKFDEDKKTLELKQKKIFNNIMNETSEKERKLIKELDAQRAAMKNYYQAQLESALEAKVIEFQNQLEQFQREIKSEAEERERLYNERFLSQIEMIVQKNEEEINLIKEKCAEEVDLYRIQLINATKTIENLESKLSEYQAKRKDIANNLHSIMETQWRNILEVLTCSSRPASQLDISESDNNKQQQHNQYEMMNNLSKSEENLKSELLRNYIEKLLNEPPKNERGVVCDDDKLLNRKNHAKKPWK